jgi:hypothetical protein
MPICDIRKGLAMFVKRTGPSSLSPGWQLQPAQQTTDTVSVCVWKRHGRVCDCLGHGNQCCWVLPYSIGWNATSPGNLVHSLLVRWSALPQLLQSRFDIGRIAKRIQGALPIVGLISRLATPEGGFEKDQASRLGPPLTWDMGRRLHVLVRVCPSCPCRRPVLCSKVHACSLYSSGFCSIVCCFTFHMWAKTRSLQPRARSCSPLWLGQHKMGLGAHMRVIVDRNTPFPFWRGLLCVRLA